jgi:hypothetical protein
MLEKPFSIGPPTRRRRQAGQGGDIHFIDQVPEKGCLCQDLSVEERRPRLERNRRQFLDPMQTARGMDVVQRNGEDQSPENPGQPANRPAAARFRAPAHDVVARVDRLEERQQVIRGPGPFRGRDENEGHPHPLEAAS